MHKISPSLPHDTRLDREFNNWDALKLVALLLMVIDHTGYFLFPEIPAFRAIGRSAAPIFLFLAGFAGSLRFRRDILILAIVLAVSGFLTPGYTRTLNILFTILLSRAILDWLERSGKKIKPYDWYMIGVVLFPTTILIEYGTTGMLFAFGAYMQRRADRYPEIRRWFWVFVFGAQAILEAALFEFSIPNILLMCLGLAVTGWVLYHFEVRPVAQNILPAWCYKVGKFLARYSAYFYVGHLILLQWTVGAPPLKP